MVFVICLKRDLICGGEGKRRRKRRKIIGEGKYFGSKKEEGVTLTKLLNLYPGERHMWIYSCKGPICVTKAEFRQKSFFKGSAQLTHPSPPIICVIILNIISPVTKLLLFYNCQKLTMVRFIIKGIFLIYYHRQHHHHDDQHHHHHCHHYHSDQSVRGPSLGERHSCNPAHSQLPIVNILQRPPLASTNTLTNTRTDTCGYKYKKRQHL